MLQIEYVWGKQSSNHVGLVQCQQLIQDNRVWGSTPTKKHQGIACRAAKDLVCKKSCSESQFAKMLSGTTICQELYGMTICKSYKQIVWNDKLQNLYKFVWNDN